MNQSRATERHPRSESRRQFLKVASAVGLASTWGLGTVAEGAGAEPTRDDTTKLPTALPRGSVPGRTLTINGARYHIGEQGAGQKVALLLHGMPDTSGVWRFQIPALMNAGYRVIAPDLLGYGKTDKPDERARYQGTELISDMRVLLDALQLRQVDLVGHDWGGFLSWELALAVPERIRRHVVISTGHPDAFFGSVASQRTVRENWYMFLNTQEAAAGLYAANDGVFFKNIMIPTHPEADEVWSRMKEPAAMNGMLNWDRANPVAAFYLDAVSGHVPSRPCRVPTLGLWGNRDTYMWEAQMTDSSRLMAAPWRYQRVDGSSHWAMLDRPAQVNESVLRWFAES